MGLVIIGEQRVNTKDIESWEWTRESVLLAVEDYVDVFWGLRLSRGYREEIEEVNVLRIKLVDQEVWNFHCSPKFLASARIFSKTSEEDAARNKVVNAYQDWTPRKDWQYIYNLADVVEDLDKMRASNMASHFIWQITLVNE